MFLKYLFFIFNVNSVLRIILFTKKKKIDQFFKTSRMLKHSIVYENQQKLPNLKSYAITEHSSSSYYFQKTNIKNSQLTSLKSLIMSLPHYDETTINSKLDYAFLTPMSFSSDNNQTLINSFKFLRKSSFISFFIKNLIDVPKCFKKVKSLKRLNYELPLLKLLNFLMRDGKKEQLQVFFFKALASLYSKTHFQKDNTALNKTPLTLVFSKINYNWTKLYLTLATLFEFPNQKRFAGLLANHVRKFPLSFKNFLTFYGKSVNYGCYVKNTLLEKLIFILPVFSFFMHNVDKNVKKYSRGKAGKYSFVWKYIAAYRRAHLTLRLIAKDVKFASGRKLQERIKNALSLVFLDPRKSFAWRTKTFSYNYVFKNYRKTLMKTLKMLK